ncbi:MAG: transcriptional repressor [Candidatus Aminicenantes bacterium]|nr:transcriptional repressor [Candidatus Aminicenantes bacterium]
MITNNDRVREILLSRGIKPTFQRQRILQAVLDDRTHPTVKALHDRLQPSVPTLSKTTLYTTLELFAAHGLVARLSIDAGEVRYDGLVSPHHHLLCASCGAIIDLEVACATGRKGEIDGHAIHEVHGYFKGRCKACLSRARTHKPRRLSHA